MNCVLGLAADPLLPQASSFAPAVDRAIDLAAWFAVFFAVLVAGVVLFALAGPRKQGAAAAPATRFVKYAVAGAVVLAGTFFVLGARVWADMSVAPRGALPIRVAFEEKGWSFTYPNGHTSGELHLPFGRPVRFLFKGGEQPYTFAVPAFRLQVPVALRQDRDAWVEPVLAGEYDLRTAIGGSKATSIKVLVHPEGGYERWYEEISGPSLTLPPLELGQKSYQMRGCGQCHSTDGGKLAGPTFKGFATREHKLVDGSTVAPDDAYIKESVQEPTAKVVAGFEPVMPSFKGRLKDQEIAGLAAYIRSLQ